MYDQPDDDDEQPNTPTQVAEGGTPVSAPKMSRTQQGYAYWKQLPSQVAYARQVATLAIAIGKLQAEVIKPFAAIMGWLSKRFDRKGTEQ